MVSLQKASRRCNVVAKFVAGRSDMMAGQRTPCFPSVQIQGDVRQNANLNWGCQLRSSGPACGVRSTLHDPTKPLRKAQWQQQRKRNRDNKRRPMPVVARRATRIRRRALLRARLPSHHTDAAYKGPTPPPAARPAARPPASRPRRAPVPRPTSCAAKTSPSRRGARRAAPRSRPATVVSLGS